VSVTNHDRLIDALTAGDESSALDVLAADPALCTTEDLPSALMLSLYQRQLRVADAIANRRRQLTLFEAAAIGDTAAMRGHLAGAGVVDAVTDDGFTALHLACFFDRDEVARLLLDSGADPNVTAVNGSDLRPLHSAVAARATGLVAVLLAAGADPNPRQKGGYTPLHAAALHGDEAIVDLLLTAGAAPGIVDDEGKSAADHAGGGGYTLLAHKLGGAG
jgi:ankyrin repeat protein